MKQLVYIIFFVSLFWISANRSEAQLTNILPKSEFTVVHTNDYYQKTIAHDTMKQMVVIKKYIPNIEIDFIYATAMPLLWPLPLAGLAVYLSSDIICHMILVILYGRYAS